MAGTGKASLLVISIMETPEIVKIRCVKCDRILIQAPLCELGEARAAGIVVLWSAIVAHGRRDHPMVY